MITITQNPSTELLGTWTFWVIGTGPDSGGWGYHNSRAGWGIGYQVSGFVDGKRFELVRGFTRHQLSPGTLKGLGLSV